jgi:hypothetical protein
MIDLCRGVFRSNHSSRTSLREQSAPTPTEENLIKGVLPERREPPESRSWKPWKVVRSDGICVPDVSDDLLEWNRGPELNRLSNIALHGAQSRVNRFERSSLLTELQGSLILVNFSVLPGRLKVYLPGLWHVAGEPDGTAACANLIVVPVMVYFPLAIFVPLRKSVSVPEWNSILHTPLRLAGFLIVAWNVPDGTREVLECPVLAKAGVAVMARVSVETTTAIQRLDIDTPNWRIRDGLLAPWLSPGGWTRSGSGLARKPGRPQLFSHATTFANSRASVINGSFRRSQVIERMDLLRPTGWFVRPSMADRQRNGVVLLASFRVTADAVPGAAGLPRKRHASPHSCWPGKGAPAASRSRAIFRVCSGFSSPLVKMSAVRP